MSTKVKKIQRIVDKLVSRYGQQDVDVQSLQSELNALKALEAAQPDTCKAGWPVGCFQTRAKANYFATNNPIGH